MTPEQPLVRRGSQALSRSTIVAMAAGARDALTGTGAVINLCQDRQRFITGLLASLMADRRLILPPSAAPGVVADLQERLSIDCVVDDQWLPEHSRTAPLPVSTESLLTDAAQWPGITLFTSGSTGAPTPHARSWAQLVRGARLLNQSLGLDQAPGHHLLATTPPQHMYGLEASIMLPLVGGHAVDAQRPLLPGDARDALARLPSPRGLITTPLQLRTFLEADDADWPEVGFLLSATAPMERELAEQAERRFNSTLYEIYGSTETGALALRQPARDGLWTPLPGVQLQPWQDRWRASGDHFPDCNLADRLEVYNDGRFILAGRDGDLVKIAGKRMSLNGLHQTLVSLPGVVDAVVLPPATNDDNRRLRALVVAPNQGTRELRRMLRERVDPAFVPRPLIRVDALPRNERGKLPADALTRLLEELGVRQ